MTGAGFERALLMVTARAVGPARVLPNFVQEFTLSRFGVSRLRELPNRCS
jgi:hypothetical protein